MATTVPDDGAMSTVPTLVRVEHPSPGVTREIWSDGVVAEEIHFVPRPPPSDEREAQAHRRRAVAFKAQLYVAQNRQHLQTFRAACSLLRPEALQDPVLMKADGTVRAALQGVAEARDAFDFREALMELHCAATRLIAGEIGCRAWAPGCQPVGPFTVPEGELGVRTTAAWRAGWALRAHDPLHDHQLLEELNCSRAVERGLEFRPSGVSLTGSLGAVFRETQVPQASPAADSLQQDRYVRREWLHGRREANGRLLPPERSLLRRDDVGRKFDGFDVVDGEIDVEWLLDRLSEEQRAVSRALLDGRTQHEIGALLWPSKSPAASQKRVSRTLAELRDHPLLVRLARRGV